MNKLNSNMIAEGIDKSIFGQIAKGIIYAMLVIVILIILASSYSYYNNWKWEREVCGEDGCPEEAVQELDPCIKAIGTNTLVCNVYNTKNESKRITYYGFCGYQEANAWFEQIKNDYGEENAKIECS